MLLLAAAVRFFHYALFDGELLSPYYYLITYVWLLATATLGYPRHAHHANGHPISLAL